MNPVDRTRLRAAMIAIVAVRDLRLVLPFLLACGFDSGGAADSSEGTGSGSESASTTTAPTSGPSTSAPTTTTGNTGASTSATASDATADATDASGGSSSADGSTAASTSGSAEESSTTSSEPVEHHVEHGSQTACDEPLWCAYNGMIDVPAGGPIEGQECFLAPVDPPYELIAMHYSVAAVHTDLEMFELRVYGWDGDLPTDLLTSIELNSTYASPMEHDIDFEPTIVVDTAGFCVGFATTEPGLASALGMAVDTDSVLPDVSFVRMEGMCDAPDWQDVIAAALVPTGNWCMDATIRTIP